MLEQTAALLRGIRIVLRATGAERAVIGIEDNKMDAVVEIEARLADDPAISVQAVAAKYPQGAEKMLVESLLGRQVATGSFGAMMEVDLVNSGPVTITIDTKNKE